MLAWSRPDPLTRDLIHLINARRHDHGDTDAAIDTLQAFLEQGRESDLLTVLATAQIDGRPLDDQQFHGYVEILVGGGNETTRNTITGGVRALLEHPDQAARLAADPDRLVVTAVEEILRWVSPVIQFARTATTDTELGGQRIAAGDTVVLWYPSANRDERQFSDPYRFDIGRDPNAHVAFGHGEHFCLGSNLARLEATTALMALLDRLPNLRFEPGAESTMVGMAFRSPDRLPVLFDPER